MSKKRPPPPPAARPTGPASPMDVGLLEQMVRLMAANDLSTVDVRDGERRVILRRGAAPVPAAPARAAPTPAVTPAPTGTAPPVSTPAPDDTAGLVPIKSPMVGTFYAAASPDAKPFVAVGSAVDDDTDVCTIEAMKNFLPIKAGVRGTIARCVAGNGQTVEFGQTLFLVKP